MKLPIFLFLLLCSVQSYSQSKSDFELLKNEQTEKHSHENEPNRSFFKGLLKLYSHHISDQIINDCIYEESCSTFSQGAIKKYGLLKGVFLSADRLSRCNRLSQSHIEQVRFNPNGKIRDHWNQYTFKK